MDIKIEQGPEPTLADVPKEFLQCLVDRMKLGRKNYGDFNQWKQRLENPNYRQHRLKHLTAHLTNILVEDYSEDDEYGNIGAILFGCMMLLEMEKRRKERGISRYTEIIYDVDDNRMIK